VTELRHKVLGTVGVSSKSVSKVKEPMHRNDLQSLIELGSIKDTIDMGGFEFTLRSLSATEKLDINEEFGGEKLDDRQVFDLNIKLLAMSIESINGTPIESLHPSPKEDVILTKMEIVAALQTPVLARLLDFYAEIAERCDKQFSVDQIKN
jgi:hypothetical protein